jgi:diguanylate cyclase (GGDEF)-like protein/PAS domain S-box-containing protein
MQNDTSLSDDLRYLKTLSVLYVEDEDDIRDQLAQFLRRRCAAVYTANNGHKGLDAFNRRKPDIVITDILMPVLDGLRMGSAIRQISPTTPLIITTAFEEPAYFQKAIDLGVDKYVTKPVIPEQLLEALVKSARSVRAEAALREVENRYRLLFYLSNIAVSVTDTLPDEPVGLTTVEGRLVDCNQAFLNLLGYENLSALSHDNLLEFIIPPHRQRVSALVKDELMVRGFTREFEVEFMRHNGDTAPVIAQLLLRQDERGLPLEILAVMRDLTEQRRSEQQLRQAACVFSESHNAIIITDAEARIVSINPAFTLTTGYAETEVIGQNPKLLSSGRQDQVFYQSMWSRIREYGHWQGEIWNRRKNGDVFPEWLSISSVTNARGEVINYIGIFSDISQLKAATEHIEFLAHYDPLTHLPNRLLLKDRVAQALAGCQRYGQRTALLFVDLDHFKVINDSLGHACGDLLLAQVAERLRNTVRETDTVARLGGDEFVVLLSEVQSVEAVIQVAQKTLVAMQGDFVIDHHCFNITPSIGISLYPDDGHDFDTLLKNADAAMYAVKQGGRNNYLFFTPSMNAGALERISMEHRLRRAQALGEFQLYYQPKVDVETGSIIGLEALLRWQHPEIGMVPPSRFIPLAEETGIIVSIGEWVLHTACRQNLAWQKQGLPAVPVAVNLSALQFRQRHLKDLVLNALHSSSLDPHYLELEITESMLMDDTTTAATTLSELRRTGIRLSIDDFGTGYSSLSYLKKLPLDTLKIDQSFVRDITQNADDAAVVSAVISMAHDLRLSVVAEGVETLEQLRFLRSRQCDMAQGYLFSRPLPADEIPPLLMRRVISVE